MRAWNGWYHVSGHTYGTWLPGDPRGWRERKHRKHVQGDYKNPPPEGSGDGALHYSRRVLKHPPVHLTGPQRELAGKALVEMLAAQEIEVLAVSIDAIHYHILARFLDGLVRPRVGQAKKHAYFLLRQHFGLLRLWQRLCSVTPIADRPHQVNVFGYIQSHQEEGAWTWTYRQGVYWKEDKTP